ncbi:MAG: phytanoyl-CoA dioxygenase family protein [Ilumatobacteraceae bacterium]
MVDRYERDGYEIVPEVLLSEEVAVLRPWCERCSGRPADAGRGMWTRDVALSDPMLADLLGRARTLAERFLGEEAVASFAKVHSVSVGHDFGRGWHQALAYQSLPFSPTAINVRLDDLELLVLLDDLTDEDHGLWFAPGYHVAPLMEHRRRADDGGYELVDPDRQIRLDEAQHLPLRAGDGVVYTLGTPHSCWSTPEPEVPVRAIRLGFRTARSLRR